MKDFRYSRRRRQPGLYLRRALPYVRRLAPAAWAAAPLLAALLLPLAVVAPRHHGQDGPVAPQHTAAPQEPQAAAQEAPQPKVSVYLSRSGQIETLLLEDYVSGVVAAEMPTDFELEALKAQAVAARTFIARRLVSGDVSGVPVPGANVTDTVSHQAYRSSAALKQEFTPEQQQKIRRAVQETRGIIMTYKGQPITASFFASSGGYTENSEEYWNGTVPYLRSVTSPWDKELTPNYAVTTAFTVQELVTKLGKGKQAVPAVKELATSGKRLRTVLSGDSLSIEVLSHTTGRRIKEISIGGQIYTGREVREKLGLRSSQFTWKRKGGQILITTYGNGHGVGMSQWGANGMAKEGGTATQILKHYYTGISFAQVSTLLKK